MQVFANADDELVYGTREVWFGDVLESARVSGDPLDSEAYAQALSNLLPTGPAWPREAGSTLQMLLLALAAELARLDARMEVLVGEADPRTTAELLADWERVAGLPDPCVVAAQTVVARRQALVGRLTSSGGQSRAFFIALAAALGYTVTITEFKTLAAAISAGIPYVGDSWANTWRVNVPETVAIREFRAGGGAAGEALRTWGNEVLECQFQRYKPAHTSVLFAYA